jgi:hypothetical protein
MGYIARPEEKPGTPGTFFGARAAGSAHAPLAAANISSPESPCAASRGGNAACCLDMADGLDTELDRELASLYRNHRLQRPDGSREAPRPRYL